MKPIFDTCEPRPDVLCGELTEDMFAARLRDGFEGQAEPAYQDADTFFRNTYPTECLRTLVREAGGRLSGEEPVNSPFVRLETSFEGGKRHNLIALYHLASCNDLSAAGDLVPGPEWLPKEQWAVAGVVGSDLDPMNGIQHDTQVEGRLEVLRNQPKGRKDCWVESYLQYKSGYTTSVSEERQCRNRDRCRRVNSSTR